MNYAYWASIEDVKKNLKKVDLKKEIKKSGIPIAYDDERIYINDGEGHTLVVGAEGSGKTQLVILPVINLSMKAGESILVNDVKGELYKNTSIKLLEEGYDVKVIDFNDFTKGDFWNPFDLVIRIYKENKDYAKELINIIASYLIPVSNPDEFWSNSASNLFTGAALYLLENDKELSLNSIFDLISRFEDEKEISDFKNKLNKKVASYAYLTSVLASPKETRLSIISVLNQPLTDLISNASLNDTLSKSTFDIMSFNSSKTALFIIPNRFKKYTNLQSLLINEIYEAINYVGVKNNVNFILDDFDELDEIKNISSMLSYSRGLRIRFINCIRSYLNLERVYKKHNIELLEMCFSNIIYLYSNDLHTLEKISKLCGDKKDEKGNVEPLVTKEELRVINSMNAIVIMARTMPLKTKMIPNYKINWGYEVKENEIPEKE